MLTNQKCPSHTNQPIRVNLSRGLFRSEHPTLFFYSSLPSQLVFSHSVYPNQYFFKWAPSSGFELFSKEERTEDFEPVPTFEVQKSRGLYFARLYVSVPILSREFGRIDMYYLSYSIMTSWWRHHMWLICHVPVKGCSAESPSCYSHFWNCQIAQFRVFAIATSFCDCYSWFIVGTKFGFFSEISHFLDFFDSRMDIWKIIFFIIF